MQSVTPIEMLPDLEDLERGSRGGNKPQFSSSRRQQPGYQTSQSLHGGVGSEEQTKMINNKFIRTSPHSFPNQAGMTPQDDVRTSSLASHADMPHGEQEGAESPLHDKSNLTRYEMPENTPSCLDVAEHVANCPICSKFYSNDKTVYIIAIVVLAIICVLLLKKVLDV